MAVQVEFDEDCPEVFQSEDLVKFALRVSNGVLHSLGNESSDVSIAISGDNHLQELNKRYKDKESPTNVLSFSYGEDVEGYLGDIIVSMDTIQKEANECKIDIKEHFAHMLVHSLLHLAGYDHKMSEDTAEMKEQESKLMLEIGFSDPHDT